MSKTKRKNNRIKKNTKEPFYKVAVKRNKIMWNLHNYGMSNEYVINHPFVKRASEKTNRYKFIVLMLCFVFVMMIIFIASYIGLLRLISTFEFSIYLIIFWLLCYKCVQLIYPWERCLQKYWSCPSCGKTLPTTTIGRGNTVVYLPNTDNTATCPYCGHVLPTELQ